MSIRSTLIFAGMVASIAAPAFADIVVETSPPAVESETAPPAREGYVWAPGYQRWEDGHYVWTKGHWVEARVHSHWVPDSWKKVDENHWRFSEGHWEND